MPSQSPESDAALALRAHRMRAGVRALFASVSLLLIVASGVASVNFNGFTLVLGCID